MSFLSIAIAWLVYFGLGGLWFTPLFGRHWDAAIGFDRPPRWRPETIYYLGPLIGCLVATSATARLLELAHAESLFDHLRVGLLIGAGIGAVITSVNAIAPNMRRPGLYAAVVGSYHALGLTVAALILYWFRQG